MLQTTKQLSHLVKLLATDYIKAGHNAPSPLLSLIGCATINALPCARLNTVTASPPLDLTSKQKNSLRKSKKETQRCYTTSSKSISVEEDTFSLLACRDILINRIDSVSEEMSIRTLGLMDAFLTCNSQLIFESLVPNHKILNTLKGIKRVSETSKANSTCLCYQSAQALFSKFQSKYVMWPTDQWNKSLTTAKATADALTYMKQKQTYITYLNDAKVSRYNRRINL